ncbi:MAG: hypothetical protein U5K53_01610 [Halanaerobiales bacterium]|nr:hypothetical protein [Halanaerobiales bacterium]
MVLALAGFLLVIGANYGAILKGVVTIALKVKLFGKKITINRNLLTFSFIFILSFFRVDSKE